MPADASLGSSLPEQAESRITTAGRIAGVSFLAGARDIGELLVVAAEGTLHPLTRNPSRQAHAIDRNLTVRYESVMIELVAPFFMPSMIQLLTWYMTLSKFSCAEIAR